MERRKAPHHPEIPRTTSIRIKVKHSSPIPERKSTKSTLKWTRCFQLKSNDCKRNQQKGIRSRPIDPRHQQKKTTKQQPTFRIEKKTPAVKPYTFSLASALNAQTQTRRAGSKMVYGVREGRGRVDRRATPHSVRQPRRSLHRFTPLSQLRSLVHHQMELRKVARVINRLGAVRVWERRAVS